MYEYFLANMWQLWAVLAVLGLIGELTSGDFYVMCLAIGAVGAAVTASFAGVYAQLIVFCVVAMLCLWLLRPYVLCRLRGKGPKRRSNADALIGRKGQVTQTIAAKGFGYVAIDGDHWKSVAADDAEIEEGARVKVTARESTILTVERAD